MTAPELTSPRCPIILTASRKKLFPGLIYCIAALALCGVFVKLQEEAGGMSALDAVVVAVGLAGACIATMIGLYGLFVPAAWSLRLDEVGFCLQVLWRSKSYKWSEVSSFSVQALPRRLRISKGETHICFNVASDARTTASTMNRALLGFNHGFLNRYGVSSNDLVALLNEWRGRYSDRRADCGKEI